MILIAERRHAAVAHDWGEFRDANHDLLHSGFAMLQRYYSRERLWSQDARELFLLPDKSPAG